MRRLRDFFERGIVGQTLLGVIALIGLTAIVGFAVVPPLLSPEAEMRITPARSMALVGEEFTVDIIVTAAIPVNVFAGELRFDPDVLSIARIDYNTSVADLWAERPWYSNGEGTLNFTGGTLRSGGFIGTESLITVTFRTLREGNASLTLREVHILQHDGLGTETELGKPIDSIVEVGTPEIEEQNLVREVMLGEEVAVVEQLPATDLNGDGRHSMADLSIFMLHIAGNDPRYDFNGDGKVNTVDLNILLGKL